MHGVQQHRGRNLLPIIDIETELRAFEAEERRRLGLDGKTEHWVERMANASSSRAERAQVTILVGGLTVAHDYLIEAALKGIGYNMQLLQTPDNAGLQIGKEFGNRGQCNPTYFTVGNLVAYLIALRDNNGMSAEEIVANYVFLTAGACGPCRFGMYVTEYRKALRDAGFDGFRVVLFQQNGGLKQATGVEIGLDLNPTFFMQLMKAIFAGDVINALGYRIRPYEMLAGSTDEALEKCKRACYDALVHRKSIVRALWRSKPLFDAVKVDRTLPKPRVAIIGEFWAMTTEGDGNYQLQRFLEGEGAEVDVQLVVAWILYMTWESRNDTQARYNLRGADKAKSGLGELDAWGVGKRMASLAAADFAVRGMFQTFAYAIGLHGYHLPDMDLLAKISHEYYNNDIRGGEGHMEVGKLIMNVVSSKAHMTLSVKPFGCMPSAGVSDGVQSAITEKFPGTIFCPVETSGDGRVNFYSRVQMYLFKAKQSASGEYERVLAELGITKQQVQVFLASNPRFGSPLNRAPHHAAGTAADLAAQVAPYITMSRWERWRAKASRMAKDGVHGVRRAPHRVANFSSRARMKTPEIVAKIREDISILVEQRKTKREAIAQAQPSC